MDFSTLFEQHKTIVFIVGGATLGLVGYSFLHKSSSSSSTPTTYNPSSGATVAPTQYLVPYTGFAGNPTSLPGSTSTSTGTPSSGVPGNGGSTGGSGSTTPSSPPIKSGYGYGGETFQSGGTTYVAAPNVQAATDYLNKGGTLYYQPSPGLAAPWDPNLNGMKNGTPTYLYEALQ